MALFFEPQIVIRIGNEDEVALRNTFYFFFNIFYVRVFIFLFEVYILNDYFLLNKKKIMLMMK